MIHTIFIIDHTCEYNKEIKSERIIIENVSELQNSIHDLDSYTITSYTISIIIDHHTCDYNKEIQLDRIIIENITELQNSTFDPLSLSHIGI